MLGGSDVSDLYLMPRVGSDIALLKALLKAVLERGGVDVPFVRDATAGWDTVHEDVERASWDELLTACQVPREQIEQAADLLVRARSGIFLWAMGLTHHSHGVDNILALANLALARGWLGRPGAGLLPIRGHSNVQGVGSVGVTPQLKAQFARRLASRYRIEIPPTGGQDTFASMQAADAGAMRAAVLLGGNLYGSNPDAAWASRALGDIDLTLTVSTKLNTGHIHGRGKTALIVPALARDEEPQPTTQESMFNFVRLSQGGLPAVAGDMRSEVDIVASLAERILPPGRFDWTTLRSHTALRRAIAEVVPGYRAIADVDTTLREFQIEGRTFHTPRFATPDGRAHFHVTPLPKLDVAHDELRLMTLRSEGQFNTVVYDEEDLYRGTTRRDVILIASEDATERGLQEGSRVNVRSSAGSMLATVNVTDIAPGSAAMYFPEANVLVPPRVDPRSKTPAFKFVPVRLETA
jgi:molybdopterin-dependent oxidoreductase alpha subunit